MDQQLIAAIQQFSFADLTAMFGLKRANQLYPALVEAKVRGSIQEFMMSLKDEDHKIMAAVAKIRVRGAHMELEGSYHHLHAVLSWLVKNALPYVIVVNDKVLTPGNCDWRIMMNLEDYRAFQDENSKAA